MKLVSYKINEKEARLGAIIDDCIVDLAKLAKSKNEYLPSSMLEFIDEMPSSKNIAEKLLKSKDFPSGTSIFKENATILAPIPKPKKNIFGIGLNYQKHIEESSKTLDTVNEVPKEVVVFTKPPTTVIGYGDAIEHNQNITKQLDWEIELAVIIGKKAKNVSKEDALDYVFGYTAIIDVSARDCRRSGQWIVSKGQDTFAPMGPLLLTADEIQDPHNLNLWLKKNGELKQKDNTKNMIFNINAIISDLSSVMTLEPGDIIATGTPDGVGAGRDPQEWMWPGDVIEAEVESIGQLYHPIIDVTNKKNVSLK